LLPGNRYDKSLTDSSHPAGVSNYLVALFPLLGKTKYPFALGLFLVLTLVSAARNPRGNSKKLYQQAVFGHLANYSRMSP
jgi:hypothetical protein